MKSLITISLLSILFLLPTEAEARHRHYRNYNYQHYHYHQGGGLVRVPTLAGPITAASHLAHRFANMISDFVRFGYRPRSVHCHARGGHIPNSRHYHGAACDIDQRGWNATSRFMYGATANAIIRKHGFRNGCSFRDCGHIDDGVSTRRGGRSAYYSRQHRHYHYGNYWW